jgi:hypothetical protein
VALRFAWRFCISWVAVQEWRFREEMGQTNSGNAVADEVEAIVCAVATHNLHAQQLPITWAVLHHDYSAAHNGRVLDYFKEDCTSSVKPK